MILVNKREPDNKKLVKDSVTGREKADFERDWLESSGVFDQLPPFPNSRESLNLGIFIVSVWASGGKPLTQTSQAIELPWRFL